MKTKKTASSIVENIELKKLKKNIVRSSKMEYK